MDTFEKLASIFKSSAKWTGGPVALADFSSYKMESDSVLIAEYNFPWGEGISSDQSSALVRPFRKIFRHGKDPGTITYVFHSDNGKFYVLGSFAFTNKRIIFFPGFIEKTLVNFFDEQLRDKGINLHIDHFSIEQNLRNWHITFEEDERKRSLNTKRVDHNNFLWFVLRIKVLTSLEPTPEKIIMKMSASDKEIDRRTPIIMKSRQNAIFQSTLLGDELKEEFIWQFEFFVNTTQDWKNTPQVPNIGASNSGVVIKDARKKVPIRDHMVLLDGFDGCVFIRVSKIIGTMTDPIQFIPGHEINYENLKIQY